MDQSPNNFDNENSSVTSLGQYCHNCGIENMSDSKFCKGCGIKLKLTKPCEECGNQRFDPARYCIFCGALFPKEKKLEIPSFKVSLNIIAVFTSIIMIILKVYESINIIDKSINIENFTQIFNQESIMPLLLLNINYIILFVILFGVSIYNLKIPRIPNKITYPGTIMGLIVSIIVSGSIMGLYNSFLGLAISFSVFYLYWKLSNGRLYGGTVKLSMMIGAFLGLYLSLGMIFFASILLILKYVWNKKTSGEEDLLNTAPILSISAFLSILFFSLL